MKRSKEDEELALTGESMTFSGLRDVLVNMDGLISVLLFSWVSSSEEPPTYVGPSSSRFMTGVRFAGPAETGGQKRVPGGAMALERRPPSEAGREGEDVGPGGEEAATWTVLLAE